jgi:hypothetical protein
MGNIKPAEQFRPPYNFSNSDEAIRRFPFPYPDDTYMYSVNIEQHTSGGAGSVYEHPFDVDEHYLGEMEDRRLVLAEDPLRCQALPHMESASWDALELIMESFASAYPDHFSLSKNGAQWTWQNWLLNIEDSFTFGDASTLPCAPLEYITRQGQGDFVLMDQRNNNLYLDAGMVTTQADWSLNFNLGMDFMEWHGPVPLAGELGVFDRALKYLLLLQLGRPVRRLNWTMTVNPHLDTSPENYDKWGPARTTVTAENAGQLVYLRVEVQTLFRLPRSNGILFGVRVYLLRLDELVSNPAWARRMHRVLRDLPPELVDYKGLSRYRDDAVRWLSQFDDGQATPAKTLLSGLDPLAVPGAL